MVSYLSQNWIYGILSKHIKHAILISEQQFVVAKKKGGGKLPKFTNKIHQH